MKYINSYINIINNMADDGLSSDEILKILFKSYMNFGSSSHDKAFFEETIFENTTNIFSNEVMKDTPTKTPNYTAINEEVVKSYLEKNNSNLVINAGWLDTKIILNDSTSGFS